MFSSCLVENPKLSAFVRLHLEARPLNRHRQQPRQVVPEEPRPLRARLHQRHQRFQERPRAEAVVLERALLAPRSAVPPTLHGIAQATSTLRMESAITTGSPSSTKTVSF